MDGFGSGLNEHGLWRGSRLCEIGSVGVVCYLGFLQDIQIRDVNRDGRNIEMVQQHPNSRHYLLYRHSLMAEWCGGTESMNVIVSKIHQREEATNKRERAMAYAFSHQA